MSALYDRIGKSYAEYRRPDPHIAAQILAALGDARRVANVGAGAGSYEPSDRLVIAVEPSETMIRQRRPHAAPAIRATAEHLPFDDDAFEAAMAILTVHHWPNLEAGLMELARIASRRVVILTWEPAARTSWLVRDYFPEIWEYDLTKFPRIGFYERFFDNIAVTAVPIPHDCQDGFLEAYWRRPETYFDAGARGAISSFARAQNVDEKLLQLKHDLDDGTWDRRNGHLRDLPELDLGYRLLVLERD